MSETAAPHDLRDPHDHHDDVPVLEVDETIAPRPEEEIADVARATPDPQGHGSVG